MIELMRPNTADLHQSIFLDEENAKKEMDQTILDERSKFGKSVIIGANSKGLDDNSYLTEESNLKNARSILKNNLNRKKEEEDRDEVFPKHDPLTSNQGDKDLEHIFKPLILQSKGTVPDMGIENLTRLHQLG